ncbi:MAG UNVERIFIED_CONTAM: hypothetical protein LVR18_01315 [Planctomycetaceae bacterium]
MTPRRGVDVAAKAEIHSLLVELAREGLSMIVASGELPELLSLCDRILGACRWSDHCRISPQRGHRTVDHRGRGRNQRSCSIDS